MAFYGDVDGAYSIAESLRHRLWKLSKCHLDIHASSQEKSSAPVFLKLDSQSGLLNEGYLLQIKPQQVCIQASSAAGLFYGVQTLCQIVRQSGKTIPACRIEDAPDFPVRGMMLDVSRDKVPTLKTLLMMIDQFAELKINHLQLYMEHTFAYSKHEKIWEKASPFTPEDILKLDAYCRQRFIDLVPNQNSFGHLTPWLKHPDYQHLSECPKGFDWPWGKRSEEPFSPNPSNPKSLKFLDGLYEELLPNFSSQWFNVGCDETFDLGQGRSKKACRERGKGVVYLEFLKKIHQLVTKHGRKMMFWGDIILEHPELVSQLPDDTCVLEWGYEAKHPFDEHGTKFKESGIPFFVCPGTSAWNSLSGRTKNCLENLKNAAKYGYQHGARGYLITDWGDHGHWQYLPTSFLGYAAGAHYAWNIKPFKKEELLLALDFHLFEDPSHVVGRLVHDMGNLYLKTGQQAENATVLFRLVAQIPFRHLSSKVTAARLREVMDALDDFQHQVDFLQLRREDSTLIRSELRNTLAMIRYGCERGIAYRTGVENDPIISQKRAEKWAHVCREHSFLWLARNRYGGLEHSLEALKKTAENKA